MTAADCLVTKASAVPVQQASEREGPGTAQAGPGSIAEAMIKGATLSDVILIFIRSQPSSGLL